MILNDRSAKITLLIFDVKEVIFVSEFAPKFYKNFKCIADRCRHNCCIGWEIDIDTETLLKYQSDDGVMKNVSLCGTPHFVLVKDDRCPFLRDDNLCEIIKRHGEGHLCQICQDHPRFRSSFDSRTEIGIGLTCEAAARLILDNDFSLEILTDNDESKINNDDETEFFEYRDEIFAQNLENFKSVLPDITVSELAKIFKDLERLDVSWDKVLDALHNRHEKIAETNPTEPFATRLFHYFVFRHLHETGLKFCVLCAYFVSCLDGDIYENARMFSSEIEYSDENIELILEKVIDCDE